MITGEIISDLRITHLPAVEVFMRESIAVLPGGAGLLGEMANYHLDTGGKRLRALIPLATYDAFGGDPEDALPIAAACELLHNATLIHDDVQDGDITRRGKPTVWARWDAAQAINLGDAMMAWAGTCMAETPTEDHTRCGLTGMLHYTMAAVAAGQTADARLKESEGPSPEAWCDVAEAKTGALFGLCLAAPATLAGALEEVHRALLGAARHLGIIFQIQDDLRDLYGEADLPLLGGDLREGKRSLPLIHGLRLSEGQERKQLIALLNAPRDQVKDQDVAWTAALLERVGAADACLREVLRRRRDLSQPSILDQLPSIAEVVEDLGEIFSGPIGPLLKGDTLDFFG